MRGWIGKGFRKGVSGKEPLLKYFEFSQPFREACDERKCIYFSFSVQLKVT